MTQTSNKKKLVRKRKFLVIKSREWMWDMPSAAPILLPAPSMPPKPPPTPRSPTPPPSPKQSPVWCPEADATLERLNAGYELAVALVRSNSGVSMPYVGSGPKFWLDRFLKGTNRIHPCMILTDPQDATNGLVFLTGDPSGVHDHLCAALLMRLARATTEFEQEFEATFKVATTKDSLVQARESGSIGTRSFAPGTCTKLPDMIIRNSATGQQTVMEVCYRNESNRDLWWELGLWAQRGQGADLLPVRLPCNVVGIEVEDGVTFRGAADRPAFLVLVCSAADEGGISHSDIHMLNGNTKLATKWQAVTGQDVIWCDQVSVPFNWLCRGAPAAWGAPNVVITLDFLVSKFVDGTQWDAEEREAFGPG